MTMTTATSTPKIAAGPFVSMNDGTQIYYKDWGSGQPVVFSHGWPLTADAWDDQMMFLASHGYRCIAHDRRGHGRSSQPWNGNEMDTYADDLADAGRGARSQRAPFTSAIRPAAAKSRATSDVTARARVAKAVLIGAVPPLMLKTAANPGGLPIEAFDEIRAGVQADRSQFFKDLSDAVLRRQPSGRDGLAGPARLVLAAGHAGRHQERVRLHQGLLGDGLHRRPEEVRRTDAHHARRRRPDRADRRVGAPHRRSW